MNTAATRIGLRWNAVVDFAARQTTIGGSSEQVGPGGNHEIRMPWVCGREKVGNNVRKRAQRPDRRVLRLRRRASEERSFCWRRSAPERWKRHHLAMEERQGVDHRWPVCRDERAVGRHPRARSQGLKPCRPVDVKASRCKGRTFRNSPSGGLERNDPRKRAAAFKNKNARLSQKFASSWIIGRKHSAPRTQRSQSKEL